MARKKVDLLNDYHLLCFDELDSTNEEAKRLAKGGASHGAFLWATRQTSGKGRQGRAWESQEGNLFVSVLLCPDDKPTEYPELSFVAAVAAHEAIEPLMENNHPVQCKWPNDILVNDKKLGGILLESFEAEDKRWVVVGLGINVESAPDDVMFPATSLKAEGVEIISAKIVLSRFIHHFIEWYNVWENNGFSKVCDYWMKQAWSLNKPIKVKLPKKEIDGVFAGIDKSGALIVKTSSGKETVQAGDIFSASTEIPAEAG